MLIVNCQLSIFNFHRGVVQLASILAWGASGRPFESGHSDQRLSSRQPFFYTIKPVLICFAALKCNLTQKLYTIDYHC